ncbi:MAG: hypothetical protein ACI4MB_04965 [Candidatus Coproplasma sp.]
MKANKVFTVIIAIALFAAFVGMITCLYNAIDMFVYTTFSPSSNFTGPYQASEVYRQLQKPLATILLVASIISLVGVVAAGLGLFCKKTVVKAISLTVSVIVALAFVGFMIGAYVVWFSYMQGRTYTIGSKYEIISISPIYIPDSYAVRYALYAAVMSALLQQLIFFAVIAGASVYFFVSHVIEVKRNKKAQAVAESTETVSAEVENLEVENNQNN